MFLNIDNGATPDPRSGLEIGDARVRYRGNNVWFIASMQPVSIAAESTLWVTAWQTDEVTRVLSAATGEIPASNFLTRRPYVTVSQINATVTADEWNYTTRQTLPGGTVTRYNYITNWVTVQTRMVSCLRTVTQVVGTVTRHATVATNEVTKAVTAGVTAATIPVTRWATNYVTCERTVTAAGVHECCPHLCVCHFAEEETIEYTCNTLPGCDDEVIGCIYVKTATECESYGMQPQPRQTPEECAGEAGADRIFEFSSGSACET